MDDGLKSLLKEVVLPGIHVPVRFRYCNKRQSDTPLTKTADGSLTAAQVMLDTVDRSSFGHF